MKKMRNVAILGMIPFRILGVILLSGTIDNTNLLLTTIVGFLILSFAADILLSRWQLHLRDDEPEERGVFLKRFGIYTAEIIGICAAMQAFYLLLPYGMIDGYSFAFSNLVFTILMAVAAVFVLIAGIIRTKRTNGAASDNAHSNTNRSGRYDMLRPFAVCGLFAVYGIIMLLTEHEVASLSRMIAFIVGIILAVGLTLTADYLLSVWQLHLRKGEQNHIADFGKRYALYLIEKIAIAAVTLLLNRRFSPFLMENKNYSLSWFCFTATMAVTAIIVLVKSAEQNAKARWTAA